MSVTLDLAILDGEYAVSLLSADSALPDWADGPGFVSVSRGDDELSIVCRTDRVPDDVQSDGGWMVMKLTGSFAFDETGVVLSVVRPLSEAKLGVFVVSTFHRDYLLVKRTDFEMAERVLTDSGHRFV